MYKNTIEHSVQSFPSRPRCESERTRGKGSKGSLAITRPEKWLFKKPKSDIITNPTASMDFILE